MRCLHKIGVGTDGIDLKAAHNKRVGVTFGPGSNKNEVADHTLGLLLATLRKYPRAIARVQDGHWRDEQVLGTSLSGLTIGILGFGNIGSEVCKRLLVHGVDIILFDPKFHDNKEVDWGLQARQRINTFEQAAQALNCPCSIQVASKSEELCQQSDVICLHMDLNSSNRRCFDDERLALCKDGVVIVNVARGELVDEAAICRALESGKVAALASDVLADEGNREGNPLIGKDNVIITPHMAPWTPQTLKAMIERVVNNALAVLTGSGEPDSWKVKIE